MFRTKRSGLVRRLWRSRLIPDREEDNGKGDTSDELCGTNTEKIPKTGSRAMTPSGSQVEPMGDSSTLGVTADKDGGTPCFQGQESKSWTVTCCLYKDRPNSKLPRDPGSCQFAKRSPPKAQQAMPRVVLQQELKSTTYCLLKQLKERALDSLLEAVEFRGGVPSDCVMVPRTELRLADHDASPELLVCKLYRWSDLQHQAQLKPLSKCTSFGAPDSPTVCCNPYHYSRLCGPGEAQPSAPTGPAHVHVQRGSGLYTQLCG